MGKWIRHRLPKSDDLNEWGEALITNADGNVRVAEWSGSAWKVKGLGWCESGYVVAWQPLPEPYKEEVKDAKCISE